MTNTKTFLCKTRKRCQTTGALKIEILREMKEILREKMEILREMKEILGLRFIKYHYTSCICGIGNDHEIDS